jgi:hypothetical protein
MTEKYIDAALFSDNLRAKLMIKLYHFLYSI